MIFEGGYAFGLVLISCELGQQMTNAFERIGDVMKSQFNWYRFPIKVQRMLPSLLIISQQPVQLECFGSNACVRESFKKVCSAIGSEPRDLRNVLNFNITDLSFIGSELWILIFYAASSFLSMNPYSQ